MQLNLFLMTLDEGIKKPYLYAKHMPSRSGSALFAQTCLSENLGKLRYSQQDTIKILNIRTPKKLL